MIDFYSLLKTALSDSNQTFAEAVADLDAVVVAGGLAVEGWTGGLFVLKLVQIREDPRGVLYSLSLLSDENEPMSGPTLETVLVPPRGYPISAGPLLDGPRVDIADKTALEQHFVKMFSNPSSALVQHLAFALRKRTAR